YHAFVSMESKRINAGKYNGEPKRKVNEMAEEISEAWKLLSKEERKNITKDVLGDLRERRANREIGRHNPGAVAAQDSFLTGERVRETLERLNVRTGDEALLIITSGSVERSHRPYVATTSKRVDDFCIEVLKLIPHDVGVKMDGFMVTGIEGVARTHAQVLLKMKHSISELIARKLQEIAGSTKAVRMNYTNFPDRITKRYGIIVRNWPLEEFVNPGSIGTKAALDTLWNAWNSNTAHFYRMSNQEFQQW
ncbi:hypothetical protein BT96DRAFT_755967, partial [Gymnopus androsaceus JB14]